MSVVNYKLKSYREKVKPGELENTLRRHMEAGCHRIIFEKDRVTFSDGQVSVEGELFWGVEAMKWAKR